MTALSVGLGYGQGGHSKELNWASAAMKKADSSARAVHSPNSYVRYAEGCPRRAVGNGV